MKQTPPQYIVRGMIIVGREKEKPRSKLIFSGPLEYYPSHRDGKHDVSSWAENF